jgi:hypothetical protein
MIKATKADIVIFYIHNKPYDYPILKREMENRNIEIPSNWYFAVLNYVTNLIILYFSIIIVNN